MRIKFIKDYKGKRKGDVETVSPNEGFGLIDSGVAEVTKDLVEQDYKATSESSKHRKNRKP